MLASVKKSDKKGDESMDKQLTLGLCQGTYSEAKTQRERLHTLR